MIYLAAALSPFVVPAAVVALHIRRQMRSNREFAAYLDSAERQNREWCESMRRQIQERGES